MIPWVTSTPAVAATKKCGGKAVTITGTNKTERLKGTNKNDVILALGGNDIIRSGGGDDIICGGTGKDVIDASTGNDTVYGNYSKKKMNPSTRASVRSTRLDGRTEIPNTCAPKPLFGDDDITAGDGDDTVFAQEGDDLLLGGEGDDVLSGGEGTDAIFGGAGNNTCLDALSQCDVEGPVPTAFGISPTSVDTSSAPAQITFTATITDNLAGNTSNSNFGVTAVTFKNPSGQGIDVPLTGEQRISGTAQNGTYQYDATLPRYSAQGTWTVELFTLVDEVKNLRCLKAADMASLGLPTTFTQTGQGDEAPPELGAFSLNPASVDTSSAAQTISMEATITDDLSGNTVPTNTQVRFTHPSGQTLTGFFGDAERTSGDELNGTYRFDAILPRGAAQGTWTLEFFSLWDALGNNRMLTAADVSALGFPTTFSQTGPGDTQPPVLTAFGHSPDSVSTGGSPAQITFTATITDNLAGNGGSNPSQVRFKSPSGQIVDALFGEPERTSGTAQNGSYSYTATVPQFAETGTWKVDYFLLVDQVGNLKILSEAAVAGMGFDTTFQNT
jgi:hypothetical protein